jgi:inorganic pyrophosphatase
MYRNEKFNRWRRHPWHGLYAHQEGADEGVVQVYVEMLPTDVVKYELDKNSGFLVVDRPQRTTSSPPALYGFIPRTYCAEEVAKRCPGVTEADGDPLDICVYSERHINRSDIILNARVVGGIQMIDGGEADDKIIAILDNDDQWESVHDISDLPDNLVERMRHYFHTYKTLPGEPERVQVGRAYGRDHAMRVIEAAAADYEEEYGGEQQDFQEHESAA